MTSYIMWQYYNNEPIKDSNATSKLTLEHSFNMRIITPVSKLHMVWDCLIPSKRIWVKDETIDDFYLNISECANYLG
jgi:hypothetical protein